MLAMGGSEARHRAGLLTSEGGFAMDASRLRIRSSSTESVPSRSTSSTVCGMSLPPCETTVGQMSGCLSSASHLLGARQTCNLKQLLSATFRRNESGKNRAVCLACWWLTVVGKDVGEHLPPPPRSRDDDPGVLGQRTIPLHGIRPTLEALRLMSSLQLPDVPLPTLPASA